MVGQARGTVRGAASAPRHTAARAGRRTRGERAGLDLGQIVEAARRLGVDGITMQAVADALGVDRKTINHHVSDRETLLELVAMGAFAERFATVSIAAHDDWRQAARTYARGFVASVIESGVLAEHLPVGGALVTHALRTTETLLGVFVSAGFTDEVAVRSVVALNTLCFGYSRDVLLARRPGERTRPLWLREALQEHDPHTFPTLERVAKRPPNTYDASQLDFTLDVFLRGLEPLAGAAQGGPGQGR